MMPAGYGVGNHSMFVVDFHKESQIGKAPFESSASPPIFSNTIASSGITKKYLSQLEHNLAWHCLIKHLGNLHHKCKNIC